jgi:hypothetical protein
MYATPPGTKIYKFSSCSDKQVWDILFIIYYLLFITLIILIFFPRGENPTHLVTLDKMLLLIVLTFSLRRRQMERDILSDSKLARLWFSVLRFSAHEINRGATIRGRSPKCRNRMLKDNNVQNANRQNVKRQNVKRQKVKRHNDRMPKDGMKKDKMSKDTMLKKCCNSQPPPAGSRCPLYGGLFTLTLLGLARSG